MGIFDIFGGGQLGPTRQTTNQSSAFNQTQTNSPWAGIQQYLMGNADTKGVYPEAASLYANTGWTPAMQDTSANWFNDVANNRNIFLGNGFQNTGAALNQGLFDPRITAAGPIASPAPVMPDTPTPAYARTLQGDLDPTKALQGFLTGDSTNPWIDKQGQAITDTLTRNLNENVLPGIRHNAIADGQYGGSRGDMAEGLALSRLDTDIAPALTQLAGNAYEAEQGRKYGAATGLNQQATDVAQANANRKLQADSLNAGNLLDTMKANTGTTLQNNAQAMQAAAQAVGNRMSGLNFATGAEGLTDQYYTDMLKSLGMQADHDWSNLGRYNSIVAPAAAFQTTNSAGTSNQSGTSTTFEPTTSNPMAGILGTLSSLASIYSMLPSSDRDLKTDITKIGSDDQTGLPLYSYRYKGDPKTYPKVVGPMAQDIERMFPDQVTEVAGRKAVNLGFGPMRRAFQ